MANVDLGAEILRDYLRFNKDGEGQVELPQFVALVESTLLRSSSSSHTLQAGACEGFATALGEAA